MPLVCECSDWDDPEWIWHFPGDYQVMPKRKRRIRCTSCNQLIEHESIVLEFKRTRYPHDDIEEHIYGDDYVIPIAPAYLCEWCADMYLNFDALGFCVTPYDNMHNLLREYHSLKEESRNAAFNRARIIILARVKKLLVLAKICV